MKKLLLILLCFPMIGFGNINIKSQQKEDSIFIKESGRYILPIYIKSNNIILFGKYKKIFSQKDIDGKLLEKLTFYKKNLDKRNIPLTISLIVDAETQMGIITDIKSVLRKSNNFKIRYKTID